MKAAGMIGGGAAFLAVLGLAAVWLRPHEAAGDGSAQTNPTMQTQQTHEGNVSNVYVKTALKSPRAAPDFLTLLGTILPGEQSTLSVRLPARIAAILVKEGQNVQKDQLLILFDASESRPQAQSATAGISAALAQGDKARAGRQAQQVKADSDIATAHAGVTQAREKLRQAQLGVQTARAADRADLLTAQTGVNDAETGLKTALDLLHSLEELDKVGGVARNDLEGARTQVKLAKSRLEAAHAAVKRIQEGPDASGTDLTAQNPAGTTYRIAAALRDETLAQGGLVQATTSLQEARDAKTQLLRISDADIRAAKAGLQQAEAVLAGAQVGAQTAHLTSPLAGAVQTITVHVGETAQPGMPLLTVVASNAEKAFRVEALVPARQLSALSVGLAARVILETRPDQPLKAVVSAVSNMAEPDGRTFRVTFRLQQQPPLLRVGQNVRIIISK